jgi:hypothetical protein
MKVRAMLLIIGVLIFILTACTIFIVRRPQPKSLSSALALLPITSQPASGTSEPLKLSGVQRLEPVSPFAIRRYIAAHQRDESASLKEFWRRLGIAIDRWQECRKCEAHIFRLQLDNEPGPEVMLRLNGRFGEENFLYLIFKLRKAGHKPTWKLLRVIDESRQVRVPPQRVITIGNRRWLVLTTLEGRGSGFSLFKDTWYEVDREDMRPVLSYTSRKTLRSFPELNASSRILSAKFESGQTRVTIRFSLRYSWDEGTGQDYTLWSKRQIASFIKPTKSKEFVLDPRRSSVTERELTVIYGDEGNISAEILKYNYPYLVRLAAGKEENAKKWLRFFVLDLRDSPETRRLKQLLGVG